MQQPTMRDLSTAIAETTSHLMRHSNLLYPALLFPHSHSIVPGRHNAQIFQHGFFRRTTQDRSSIRLSAIIDQ